MPGIKVIRKLRNLFDVTFGTPSDGDVVTYDSGTDKFVLAAPVAGASELDDLDDVVLAGLADGDRLEYDLGTDTWQNVAPVAVGPHGDSHENGGSDEIDLEGLSGVGADMPPETRLLSAGAGLAGGGDLTADRTFSVNVDGATIEIDSDTLQVVAGVFAMLSHVHAGEDIDSGTVADARIAATIARDSEVTAAIAAALAAADGAGLSDNGSGVLAVNVDGSTIEISGDALRVVAGVFAAASHAHAGEDITSGTVADARIAATIARDSEVTAAIAAHESAGDPHPTYTTAAEVVTAILSAIAAADGAGLSDNGSGVLAVNVDDSTIEISGDALRVKDGGITAAKVAADVATQAELDALAAPDIAFTPTGTLAADDVAEALAELDSEKTTAAAALAAAQTEIADQRRAVVVMVSTQDGTAITTGDGKAYFSVPDLLDGHNLVSANIALVGTSSSGDVQLQVHNLTQAADMLTTRPIISASELHSKDGTPGVVDAANDDVAYGDLLRFDIDQAGTGADGLMAILEFEAP